MAGLFYGIQIAKSALNVSQQALNLTGHNISNVNTVGYTRQRIIQASIDPSNGLSRVSMVSKGAVGGGVSVALIDQVRSDYIDRQYRSDNATLGKYSTRAEELEYIETILNEHSDSSISASLADFFNSLSELSVNADNSEIRTNVQQNALKMIETFHHYYNTFTDLQSTYNESMKVTVGEINDLLNSITNYNQQVYSYELSGEQANDLRDKRNVLLDELSGLINITYRENADGHLIVSCEGTEIINHTTANYLTTVTNPSTGFYDINYQGTGAPFVYNSGKLQAYKDLRDGSTVDNLGIPYILNSLNKLARSLAEEFNAVNSTGYTMPFDSVASQTGINFFAIPPGGYGDITAGNLSLSAELLASGNYIAASDKPIDLSAESTQKGNNVVALKLAALSERTDLANVGSFEDFLNGTVVQVGIESTTAQALAASQQAIIDNLEARRQSISGVSLDEEMVQMISYQHSYAAASRVLTAMDEALEVLINRTGRVGL